MRTPTMRRRPGITLVEVLVAIFIMAIGLLALLTLFPLGALRMAQALQNDRTASAASAGANICDAFGIRTDPSFLNFNAPTGPVNWYLQPPPPPAPFPPFPAAPGTNANTGYPLYVDPYGFATNGGAPLGAMNVVTTPSPPTPGIPRVVPSVIPGAISEPNGQSASQAARFFTLLDDISFATNGQPDLSTNSIQRGDRYTWAYMLHNSAPRAQPSSANVKLTVVVYANRVTSVPGVGEATYKAPVDPAGVANVLGNTSVLLQHAGTPPDIRRGTWILDTSYTGSVQQGGTGSVHGDFYRVVSVTTGVLPNTLNLELETALTKSVTAVTVMDNVVEVFDRDTGDSTKWEFR